MRGTVTGLDSPHPLGGLMPAVYQDDNFTMRWTGALDSLIGAIKPAHVIHALEVAGS